MTGAQNKETVIKTIMSIAENMKTARKSGIPQQYF
jgi:hypothetical protein